MAVKTLPRNVAGSPGKVASTGRRPNPRLRRPVPARPRTGLRIVRGHRLAFSDGPSLMLGLNFGSSVRHERAARPSTAQRRCRSFAARAPCERPRAYFIGSHGRIEAVHEFESTTDEAAGAP